MHTLVALLRAVNVGGTGKLPMAELRALCERAGFTGVRTYIQSGNVVLRSRIGPEKARAVLERGVGVALGKPAQVMIRTADELEAVMERNPFPDAAPGQLLVVFLHDAPPAGTIAGWRIPGRERLELLGRELFIHFPDGMGRSKLKIPFADVGTGRNLNTVRTLVAMARETGAS